MQLTTKHKILKNGIGLCSVPLWRNNLPAGFCDKPAYSERPKPKFYFINNKGQKCRSDNRFDGYVPGLACPSHGGYRKEEVLNLCNFCNKEFAICQSNPKFGCGFGNDNVFECDNFEKNNA